jgi:hypothetical protein
MELIAGPASATPAPATEIKDAARIARNGAMNLRLFN